MRLLMVLITSSSIAWEASYASHVATVSNSKEEPVTHLWCRSIYGGENGGTQLKEFVFNVEQDLTKKDLSDAASLVEISYDRLNYDFRISYKNKRSNEGVKNYFYLPPRSPGNWARRANLEIDLFEQEVDGVRVNSFVIYCATNSKVD